MRIRVRWMDGDFNSGVLDQRINWGKSWRVGCAVTHTLLQGVLGSGKCVRAPPEVDWPRLELDSFKVCLPFWVEQL